MSLEVDQIVLSESESETENELSEISEEESEEEVTEVKLPPKKVPGKMTKKQIGDIEVSQSPTARPRRKYQPRKPLSEEAIQRRRDNLKRAR